MSRAATMVLVEEHAAWEQATRHRWWALALLIKATLEAIEGSSFQSEMLNKTVLPGGMTADTWLLPQIEQAYGEQRSPPLLPGPVG